MQKKRKKKDKWPTSHRQKKLLRKSAAAQRGLRYAVYVCIRTRSRRAHSSPCLRYKLQASTAHAFTRNVGMHCACVHTNSNLMRGFVANPPPPLGVSVAKHRAPVLQTCGLGRASSDTSKKFRFEVQTCSWKTVIGASCPPAPQSYRCLVIAP